MSKRRYPTTQLRFDDDLAVRMRRINRPRRRLAPGMGFMACIAIVVGLAFGGTDYVPWHLFQGRGDAAVARVAEAVVYALRSDELEGVAPYFADTETGAAVLAAHNERVMADGSVVHAGAFNEEPPAGVSSRDFLAMARRHLAQQGVSVGQIVPLAFGGIEARVIDTTLMNSPAVSITGEVYFQAGGDIHGLEFTARRMRDDIVITGFWRCQRVNVPENELRLHARERYPLDVTDGSTDGTVKISRPRHIFVTLRPEA